jgi:hypothetical protein
MLPTLKIRMLGTSLTVICLVRIDVVFPSLVCEYHSSLNSELLCNRPEGKTLIYQETSNKQP